MAIHENIKPSDQELPLLLAGKALTGVRSLASRPTGTISVENPDGTSIVIGAGGDGPDGIAQQVGKTSQPGTPTGLSVSATGLTVSLMWDGTSDGIEENAGLTATLTDESGTSIQMGETPGAGTLVATATVPGLAHVTARTYDNAHDTDGNPSRNLSQPVTLDIVLSEIVDSQAIDDQIKQVNRTLDDNRQALDQANTDLADARKSADSALSQATDALARASAAASTASDASQRAASALANANQALARATHITMSSSAPSSPARDDVWFPTDTTGRATGMKQYDGASWVDVQLVAGSVLVPGSVGSTLIADGAVTTPKLEAGSVDADKLAANSVNADKLTANSVTADKLGANAVTADKIAADSVGADQLKANAVTADKADIGSLTAAIITSGKFQTATSGARVAMDSNGISAYDSSNAPTFQIDANNGDVTSNGGTFTGSTFRTNAGPDRTEMNNAGVTVYKGGKAYAHLGSDTTYGLQTWNPFSNSMTDVSLMSFGAASIVETSDQTTASVSVKPHANKWTPWKDLDPIQENGSWKRFRSPSGRFFVALVMGYRGKPAADFVYLCGNINFEKNNSGTDIVNDYPSTHAIPGAGLAADVFTPTPFVGLITVEPNVDYSVHFSFRSAHLNTNSRTLNGAYGHCNYRRLFIMPV